MSASSRFSSPPPTDSSVSKPLLSLIVPVWGDDLLVAEQVRRLAGVSHRTEWVVAAVNATEELRSLEDYGLVRLVHCERASRGGQMNAGAAIATGSLLCFHHADSELLPEHLSSLEKVVADRSVVGGAFHRKFDGRHRWLMALENVVRVWSERAGPLFGDQSVFVKEDTFREMGGFAPIPLMEDIEFSRRLRKRGRVVLLDPPILSSPRRFEEMGNWKTTLCNAAFILLFYLGVSPHRLHRWYYRNRR